MDPVANTADVPVNLDTVNPVTQPVSLDLSQTDPAPTAAVSDVRSKKASYGLGELLGKSQQEIYSLILMGKEGDLRKEAATKLDQINEQNRQQYLLDIIKKNGKTLTLDQMEELKRKPTDPNSVFEDGYAKRFLDNLYKTSAEMDNTDVAKALGVSPDTVLNGIELGKSMMSNIEYARRKQEDISQSYENQGWLPWIADQAKNIIPFYSDVKLRGWLKDQGPVEGWLQGDNLESQTRVLLRLPGPQFRQKLDEILTRLNNDNPTLALQYSNAVLGLSSRDIGLANFNNVIDVLGLPGLTPAIKSGLKAVQGTRNAIKDAITHVANEATPTPATVAEAFGDTGTAAALRASDTIVADMKGETKAVSNSAKLNTPSDPITRAKQALPSGLQLDKENIAANGRPLSQELLNRIVQDQEVASKRIVDVIEKTASVQRIPLDEAGAAVMNRLKEEVKNQNPGIKNAIADIGEPVWNPFGKNYDFPVKLFSPTGEQFATEDAARRFMKDYGIAEAEISGKPGVKYYIPEAAVKRTWESTPRIGEVIAKNGEVRVFTDDGAEVVTSLKPAPGMIPISVDAKGKVTFHPTLRSSDDIAKATIEQNGLGYHINIWKPLNEGQSIIKDLMINLDSTKSLATKGGADAWFNSIFPVGYARSSDATLSPFETLQRKTAVYSISNFQKLLQNEVKYIQDVARGRVRVDPITGEDKNAILSYIRTLSPITSWKAKDSWAEFKRALEAAPGLKDPVTGANGYLLSNPFEINEFWRANFNRPASFEEIRAWLAFKRNYENDRAFRSVREYANKARLGAEQHQVHYIDKKGEKRISPFFEGVQLKELPGGEYPIAVLDGPQPRIMMTNRMGSSYKTLNEAVLKGEMVATEIYNPKLRPLKDLPDIGNNYVRYVITPAGNRQTKPLDWNQVNRLSGGHFNYDYEFAIKEADIQETRAGNSTYHSYEGDKFFAFPASHAQGKQIITVLNEVKRLLRDGNEEAARDVFENGFKGAQGPSMSWKDFFAKTRDRVVDGKFIPASINVNEPFYVVRKGKNILDVDDSLSRRYGKFNDQGEWTSTFQDRTKSGSLADQYKVGYTQERDAENPMELRNVGSKNNPIWNYQPAKMVDPIVTMNRALNEITRSVVMDDMKIAGVETWLREAEPYLKARDIDEIRSSPWRFFKNADSPDAFRSDAPYTVVRNLLSNRFKTQQFLGTPSKYDLFMQDTAQKIADWSYDNLGPKGELVPTWLFTKTTSPVSLLRSMAYHYKLGLGAISQVLTQSQTYLTIASLAPRSAPSGTYGALLTQWAKMMEVNPKSLDLLDEWATKLSMPGEKGTLGLFHGWKRGEWKEAYEEMHNRGFPNVGGEYGPLDTQLGHKYFRGIFGDVLDAGQIFFKMAEQNVRYGAWFTAYKEYRAANPAIRNMSKTDWDKVLDRADDMTGNMSRASASIMQSGPLALTGQFLTYQTHLGELFWGKRIGGVGASQAEHDLARLRMAAMYSAVFGVGAVGVTGLPLTEIIRKAAIENGYVVGDDWLQSMAGEGGVATGLAWATSPDGDISKGNWYNINAKFGAGGLTAITDLWKSDAKWYTFIGGAATAIAANNVQNAKPLLRSSWDWLQGSMMTGRPQDEAFPMTNDDWVDMFKEISIVDAARKGYMAVMYGKWLSKNDGYQADVSKANGIFMALTGLNLQDAADNYIIGTSLKDRQENEKKALNNFTREFRRGILDAENDDWETFNKHMTRAYGWLKAYDYPIEEYPKAVSIASKNYETRINSIREQFYLRNVPAGKEETYSDAFTKFLQGQEGRLYVGPNRGQ